MSCQVIVRPTEGRAGNRTLAAAVRDSRGRCDGQSCVHRATLVPQPGALGDYRGEPSRRGGTGAATGSKGRFLEAWYVDRF